MQFVDLALSFPTVLFSGLLCVSAAYWAMVMIGALDIDMLDAGEAAEGLIDGAGEAAAGAMDGAADGALDGGMDGAVEGAVDAGADAAIEGAAHAKGALATTGQGLLAALGLRSAPITVVVSMLSLLGWGVSFTTSALLGPLLPGWAVALIAGPAALLVAVPFTALAIRPLRRVFQTAPARRRADLVGRMCEVTTGRVDSKFGQADCIVGGDHFLIQVRCARGDRVRRGESALIIDYDPVAGTYTIEPMDDRGA